jgi:hypothetical protein
VAPLGEHDVEVTIAIHIAEADVGRGLRCCLEQEMSFVARQGLRFLRLGEGQREAADDHLG